MRGTAKIVIDGNESFLQMGFVRMGLDSCEISMSRFLICWYNGDLKEKTSQTAVDRTLYRENGEILLQLILFNSNTQWG